MSGIGQKRSTRGVVTTVTSGKSSDVVNWDKVVTSAPKSKSTRVKAKTSRMTAVWSPGGSYTFPLVEKLIASIQKLKQTVIVIEFPCVGIPRVAYELGLTSIDSMSTIDQLLIDYDRGMFQSVHDYILPLKGFDALLIQPKMKPDEPTLVKLEQEETLHTVPALLKSQLSGYDHVICVLQGQLIHPMTFFSIREADDVIVVMDHAIELIYTHAVIATLQKDYSITPYLFDVGHNDLRDFKDVKIYKKIGDITEKWGMPV